jgi:hypothetical protein
MAARTLVAMAAQVKRTTSREPMSYMPVAVAVAATAILQELAELVAVEMEVVGEMKSQRKALTDLVAVVELPVEALRVVSVNVAGLELSLCVTQRLRLRQTLLHPLSLAPQEQAQHCQLLLMPGLVHPLHIRISGSVRHLLVARIPTSVPQQAAHMF